MPRMAETKRGWSRHPFFDVLGQPIDISLPLVTFILYMEILRVRALDTLSRWILVILEDLCRRHDVAINNW